MNKFKRFEGVTDAVMKSVTDVMRQSSKAAYEEKAQDAQKMAARYESVRPKTDVEKSVRPIERMYASMKPTKAAPKEETIAERVQMIAEQMGTTPKTDKHKKLAAFVHPKDKITHADVLRARGVPAARGGSRGATSEETEQQAEEQVAEEEKSEKLWPGTPAWKAKFGSDREKHELKYGKSDAKKLKPYGYRDDPEDSPMSAQTKGRGRPKKVRTEEAEVEEIDEVSSYTKVGKLVRKFIPGQGQKQAGERAKDQKYSAGLDRAALKYHPDDKKLATTMKSSEKAQKRYERISRGEPAFKSSPNDAGVKEEVESIEELSKSTLASYAKKSSNDARVSGQIAKDFENKSSSYRKPGMKAGAARLAGEYKKRAWKREDGTMKAIDRLAKEEFDADTSVTETEDYLFSQEEIDRLSEIASSFNPQQ